ncbi:riboflavin synthase domain-like protein [Cryphonectria parasitica EP155]|uniref:NADPH-dependent diflavin oxidoreductase 1 n=1 Tax=Cryphonectria parasitica (strain ATCC 38755 / EP155) TaxID=660469 RepID=A0A9P4Y761_CRYP1|nr:riboflavin synthase domain-like protein [Cryphonectria parasitica EP155]KAF3767798.1 riboflavin synthase domain-like protein [Cryphonectria parasitica EP155]
MEARQRKDQPGEQELEGRSLLILYGTETGHSQEIAEEIREAAERLRFQTLVEQMNDVSLKELAQYLLVIFVTSTTGQGDMPANATAFWKSLLRKKLPLGCLHQLNFTIFGLGDSSYPKFNWAARKLQKRLLQLGATEVYPAGEGDEKHDNGIDSIYLPWYQGLQSHLSNRYPLPSGIAPIPNDQLLPPKYPIEVAEMDPKDLNHANENASWEANREKHAALSHVQHPKSTSQEADDQDLRRNDLNGYGELARHGALSLERLKIRGPAKPDGDNILKDHPHKYDLNRPAREDGPPPTELLPIPGTRECKLLSNKRVTPDSHWQDVRLLTMEIYKSDWNKSELPDFLPGDTIMIYPKNFPSDVQKLIHLMGWDPVADLRINWSSKLGQVSVPRGMHPIDNSTLRDILLHNLDFNAIPTRTFLKQLRRHTRDEREQERLLELTLESNTQEFYDYTSRPRRTILEVLEDFPGVQVPVRYALEAFPIIRGRAFSIANSAFEHHDETAETRIVELLVALVEYKTIIRKPRRGLCSRYIQALEPGTRLAVGINPGHPPPFDDDSFKRPLIGIATGTGIAPIRSLIQHRHLCDTEASGKTLLFYGCRSKDADFHFEGNWRRLKGLAVVPAFSRDPINEDEKSFLDPYAKQESSLGPSGMSAMPGPIGPQNTPWIRSFDYDRGKMYVQHQIRRYAQEMCNLIMRGIESGHNPIIMICGNAGRMPVSVRLALEDALVIGGLVKDNEAAKHVLQEFGVWMETW